MTGGGSGVGADIAKAFASRGARVAIAGRRSGALDDVARSAKAIVAYPADVSDESAVKELFDALSRNGQTPDIVIANAGIAESTPLTRTSLEVWQRTLAINLTGVFLTFRAALSAQSRDSTMRLIAIASTAGLKGYPYVAAYCASKHGVVGLVRAVARELADRPVTVNAICPGFIETPMLEQSVANIAEKTGMTVDEARAQLAAANPQKRFIETEEVTATALWLCGDAARSVTGQAISVSGGEV